MTSKLHDKESRLAFLEEKRQEGLKTLYPKNVKIAVGMATCGRSTGADKVYKTIENLVNEKNLEYVLEAVGCIGYCQREPIVSVHIPGRPKLYYADMNAKKAAELVEAFAAGEVYKKSMLGMADEEYDIVSDDDVILGKIPEDWGFKKISELPFYGKQMRLVTRNSGIINPLSIDEYIARGGYKALALALSAEPEEVIEDVKKSGLRGRGGAGFPAGEKWAHTRHGSKGEKFTICNADEGDPGAYMDRSVLECDPHSVIEGMIISGYAIGANTGIIYVRAEYPLAIEILLHSIEEAKKYGLLGDNIFGSDFSFELRLAKGAGAFVCGEGTAMINSIEGRRGEPRVRPPRLSTHGLWKTPTNINNVETFANISPIIARGGDWFAGIGTEGSKGTKVFSLVGNVKNNGLVEVPMGTTLRDIIFTIGEGIEKRRGFKGVQIGGPSGGVLTDAELDAPVDYESLKKAGAMMGSGGLVVMSEHACMVEVARFFLHFGVDESCGKCTPCREGTKRMYGKLKKICDGEANLQDVKDLEALAKSVRSTSFCALGQTIANPVLTTLKHFRNEYEAHITDHFCPAGVCTALFQYSIDQDVCVSCGKCKKECPQDAIIVDEDKKYSIVQEKCAKCRICLLDCPTNAVKVKNAPVLEMTEEDDDD